MTCTCRDCCMNFAEYELLTNHSKHVYRNNFRLRFLAIRFGEVIYPWNVA